MIWSPVGTPNQVCIMQTAGWVEPADIDMWTVTIIHLSIAPYPLVGFMDKVNLTNFHLDKWSPRHCPTRASLFTDKCILTCVTRTSVARTNVSRTRVGAPTILPSSGSHIPPLNSKQELLLLEGQDPGAHGAGGPSIPPIRSGNSCLFKEKIIF